MFTSVEKYVHNKTAYRIEIEKGIIFICLYNFLNNNFSLSLAKDQDYRN